MPTYQYACTACDHRFEEVQSFSDDALTECPECSGRLRKLYGSVGVVFKGSGFYRTDSRSKKATAETPAKDGTAKEGTPSEKSSSGSSTTSSSSSSSSSSSGTDSSSSSSGKGASAPAAKAS